MTGSDIEKAAEPIPAAQNVDLKKVDLEVNDPLNAGKDGEGQNASMSHFWRIYTYAEPIDWVFLAVGAVASIGGGVTMPLMNIVFGQVVGDFSVSEGESLGAIDAQGAAELAKKLTDATNRNTLYIIYLFIAKLFLIYISDRKSVV